MMTLRLFKDDSDSANNGDDSPSRKGGDDIVMYDTSALARFEHARYTVFPPYGNEFADLSVWKQRWESLLPGRHKFWPGFTQGGILGLPVFPPGHRGYAHVQNCAPQQLRSRFEMAGFSNPAGEELREYVDLVRPPRYSKLEILMGAKQNPKVTVAITPEHLDSAGHERFILVVPKEGRRSVKFADRLPEWLNAFGITATSDLVPPSELMMDEMREWFFNTNRPMCILRIQGGLDNAAWQTAVLIYIASYWNLLDRGLQDVHFVARIQGSPNYRRKWTSNK